MDEEEKTEEIEEEEAPEPSELETTVAEEISEEEE